MHTYVHTHTHARAHAYGRTHTANSACSWPLSLTIVFLNKLMFILGDNQDIRVNGKCVNRRVGDLFKEVICCYRFEGVNMK